MAVSTARRRVVKVRTSSADLPGSVESVGDELTVEAPLNLIVAGESIATLMRTPGHDIELAAGWLTVESGARTAWDLYGLGQCRTEDGLALRAAEGSDGMTGRGIDQVHVALADGVQPPR